MQLNDLVKPIDTMTDDELLERLRFIRNNRNIVRPAAARHVKKAAKKGSQGRVSKVEALLAGLSDAERKSLMEELGAG